MTFPTLLQHSMARKKVYKIFGISILEVETLSPEEAETRQQLKSRNPQGVILDITPAELEKEEAKETSRKMEGK